MSALKADVMAAILRHYTSDRYGFRLHLGDAADDVLAVLRDALGVVPDPKPAEPTEFGAMVKDRDGVLWVKYNTDPAQWMTESAIHARLYADIDAVEVLAR